MKPELVDREFANLSFNARLLMKELASRSIELKELGDTLVIKATLGNHSELLYDVQSTLTSYPIGMMIDDKYYSKKILENYGYKVSNGSAFYSSEKKEAVAFAKKIGFPVVLKPTIGSHGDHVYLNIQNTKELNEKIDRLTNANTGNGYFLIEAQAAGEEYRLFITNKNFFAVVNRIPPSVIGDGASNLKELTETENHRRMNPRDTCLCEIKLDHEALDFLKKKDLNFDYIPKADERVFLRGNSNVSTGGNCNEVTDQVHPSLKQFAQQLLKDLDLPYVGIDLLTENVDRELKDYVICELNSAPGLSLHMMPEKGSPKNAASALVDSIFPETVG